MIDLSNFIIKEAPRKNPRFVGELMRKKYFHCLCIKCGADRGFLSKSRHKAKPMCIKCSTNTVSHKSNLKKSHWSRTKTYVPPKPSDETLKLRKEKEKEYCRAYWKQYYEDNKKDIHKKRKQFETNNINHRLAKRLRSRLRNAIVGKYRVGSAVKDLGCSIDEFKAHIESKFKLGMCWENWGRKGWHIDHITPLSAFDLTNHEQLKRACHYTNLQPLWAKENLSKSDKVN